MSNTLRNIVLILVVFVLGVVILGAGFFIGRMTLTQAALNPGWMMGLAQNIQERVPYNMLGMMGGTYSNAQEYRQNSFNGSGMMGSGGMGSGMMGGFSNSGLVSTEPLSIEQAEGAVKDYLNQLGDENLEIKEVMIFDNHAYVEIAEKDTGIGAMEVLVDPVSLAVYPEPGPNMMWNLKYGMMSGYQHGGMMGGMMDANGLWGSAKPQDTESSMPVSPDEAVSIAQQYLEQSLPGTQAGSEADVFYGYYTIHVERDGNIAGMLSVNGYTKQVFLHTWHGDFVEMSEEAH